LKFLKNLNLLYYKSSQNSKKNRTFSSSNKLTAVDQIQVHYSIITLPFSSTIIELINFFLAVQLSILSKTEIIPTQKKAPTTDNAADQAKATQNSYKLI
jgi:hypothetical protein